MCVCLSKLAFLSGNKPGHFKGPKNQIPFTVAAPPSLEVYWVLLTGQV